MNHKRKRPKNRRAGCSTFKPCKGNGNNRLSKKEHIIKEDMALLRFANERERTFDPAKTLTHEQVWG